MTLACDHCEFTCGRMHELIDHLNDEHGIEATAGEMDDA